MLGCGLHHLAPVLRARWTPAPFGLRDHVRRPPWRKRPRAPSKGRARVLCQSRPPVRLSSLFANSGAAPEEAITPSSCSRNYLQKFLNRSGASSV
jgi:hypothetical protein